MDFFSRKSKSKSKSKSIREDDAAPLLENDVLASSFEDSQSGFDSLEDSSDMASDVSAVKKSGRKAKARASDLSGTRRGEAAAAAGSAVKHAAMVGADVLLPGAGTAAGALDGAKAVRDKSKEGRSGTKQTAKQSAGFAVGFIPVIGPFVAFAEDIYGMGKATFQPAKERTKSKLAAAKKLISEAEQGLEKLAGLRERLAEYDGPDRDTFEGQLNKAERRLNHAIADGEAWMAKKSDKGSLPLLGDSEES